MNKQGTRSGLYVSGASSSRDESLMQVMSLWPSDAAAVQAGGAALSRGRNPTKRLLTFVCHLDGSFRTKDFGDVWFKFGESQFS